jgi:hypothetical protein
MVRRTSNDTDQSRFGQVIVTHHHMREIGYCNRGARLFCSQYGIDWADFLENGITADRLRATGDAQAERLADHAEKD